MSKQGDAQLEDLIRREADARGASKDPDHLRESFLLERITLERTALAAFMDACTGTDPDVSALDWLSAILTEVEHDPLYVSASEDQPATRTALRASRQLLDGLRAAVREVE